MSSRQQRLERVLRLRDERLGRAVLALNEARAHELAATRNAEAARAARARAEAERRALCNGTTDLRSLMEADAWLRSRSVAEELADHKLRHARGQVAKAELKVREAATKLRQIEHLQERLTNARRQLEQRAERRIEDEIAQRIAIRNRG